MVYFGTLDETASHFERGTLEMAIEPSADRPTQSVQMPAAQPDIASIPATRRLTELRAGDAGAASLAALGHGDRALLHALGLTDAAPFRLCKSGDPWIVQVRGTRIGLAKAVADQILVRPAQPSPA
jgi:Fe2+ transport system protein FeoA